jgi:hypothetical protein
MTALDLRGYETRNESVLPLLAAAERDHDVAEFAPVMVHTGDRPLNGGDPSWRSLAFARADDFSDIAVPDFLFDGWPQVGLGDYEHAGATAGAAGAGPAQTMRLGWIGNCDTNPIRWRLHELGAAHAELLDVEHVSWVTTPGSERLSTVAGNQLTLAKQVARWGLLIDVEGNGWSARLKLLLHSGRPLFVQDPPWQEFFWDELEPMTHFIPVRRDLGDLVDQVRWAIQHPERAQEIGRAGQAFARTRLSRAAAVRAWSHTLAGLAAEPVPGYAPAPVCQVLDPVLAQLGAPVSSPSAC